jgi:hypothetical protein
MSYGQCYVCKKEYKTEQLKTYHIKVIKKNERLPYLICETCLEFLLNIYFEKYATIHDYDSNWE